MQVFDADEAADAATLNAIADWCDRFTPLVALDPPHGLFLDITGCAHLFGGEAAMMRPGVRRPDRAGFCRQRRASPVRLVCARTLTRHVHGRIVRDGEEATAVRPLPVSALGADMIVMTGLRRAGLENHRRCRGARTARNHRQIWHFLHGAIGAGAGASAMRRSARASRCPITSWKSVLPSRSRPKR